MNMNKKLVMAGALGLVALGAGAFALAGLGGGSDDAPARQAHAEAKATDEDASAGDTAAAENTEPSLGDGHVIKLADPVSPAPSSHDANPSTSTGLADAAPSESDDDSSAPADEDSAGETGEDTQGGAESTPGTPNIPDGTGVPTAGDGGDDDGSPIIYNEAVADAICQLLGCNQPTITPDPDLAHDLCELMNCDDGPVTVTPNVKPCQITGNCPPPPIIYKDLGLGTIGIGLRD